MAGGTIEEIALERLELELPVHFDIASGLAIFALRGSLGHAYACAMTIELLREVVARADAERAQLEAGDAA